MMREFVIQRTGLPWEARVYVGDSEVAELKIAKAGSSHLIETGPSHHRWSLTPKVDGHFRPFSMIAREMKEEKGHDISGEAHFLKIKDGLFHHKGKFYMLGAIPEGVPPKEVLTGAKFICRLDSFPFSEHEEIDHETRNKLRRMQRGVSVGEIFGFGPKGSHVKLESELDDISLPLAASIYMISSTA